MAVPDDDPRSRTDGLGWTTRAVFAGDSLWLGFDRAVPEGTVTAARFAVVPSLRAPRFLLPMAGRRVQSATLLAYNRLRTPAVRRSRALLAAAVTVSPTLFGRLPVLTVALPAGAAAEDLLITDQVGKALGLRLVAGIGVHTPDPNAKPTLQLFDGHARPRAYVKVGWNDATRALVRNEATALAERVAGDHYPVRPAVLAQGTLGQCDWVAVSPLPERVVGVSPQEPPQPDAILAVARQGGAPGPRTPLRTSPVAPRLSGRFAPILERHGETLLEYGAWHGDWVPWNLGRWQGRVVAWDWEHSGAIMPVGSDLAHYAFQVALTVRGRDAVAATEAAQQALAAHAPALGLDRDSVTAVVDVYLAELWQRTARLAAGGGGWNPRLHPHVLDVLEQRLG